MNYLSIALWTALWTLVLAYPSLNADAMTVYTFAANLLACEILVTCIVGFCGKRLHDTQLRLFLSPIVFCLVSAVIAFILFEYKGAFGAFSIAPVVCFYMLLKVTVLYDYIESERDIEIDQYGLALA